MRPSDKAYLDSLEVELRAMHQPHQPHLECPSHELAYDEDDFQRVFGAGDEQQERPVNIYQDWDDSGHGRGDFC